MQDIITLLNEKQKKAVFTSDKNILILAGAGTGKTLTITAKIVYLIRELNYNPENILAVTFTNKASNEMKERVEKYLGKQISIMIKTFHSFCAYILRNEASFVKRNRYFQILDVDDSLAIIKKILKEKQIESFTPAVFLKLLQIYKQNEKNINLDDARLEKFINLYEIYEDYLEKSNCFDFEDLLLKTVELFQKYPEILAKYQDRFKYILVDEYQDTNKLQFKLLWLLTTKNTRLAVVGDEDQSIYGFRGADIRNILNFSNEFENVEVIRLELNYRSNNKILNVANKVIENNRNRLGKTLFSENKEKGKIILFDAWNELDEATKIVELIKSERLKLDDTAILYRINNQSRPFEQILSRYNIPFIVIGSIAFYEREEIKDALSILKWLINRKDRLSFLRFINKPNRGIGEKTIEKIFLHSEQYENDIFLALENIKEIKIPKKAKGNIKNVYNIFKEGLISNFKNLEELLSFYLKNLGIFSYYEEIDKKEGTEKSSNLKELISSVQNIGVSKEEILAFLETTSLSPLKEEGTDTAGKLKLFTVHNAKGLEFENVFIAGMEDGLFPSILPNDENNEEEERRLFYVAITRAKRNLFISYCLNRNLYGTNLSRKPSRFLEEIPLEHIDKIDAKNFKNFFKEGDIVQHKDYGKGKILKIETRHNKKVALIDFYDYNLCEILIEHTKLEKVSH